MTRIIGIPIKSDISMQALPYIILGVCLTIGIALTATGCLLAKNWFALIELVPAFFVALFAILYLNKDDSDEEGIITIDFLVWGIVVSIVSIIGVPTVLHRIGKIEKIVPLVLDLAGCIVILGGIIGIQFFHHDYDDL